METYGDNMTEEGGCTVRGGKGGVLNWFLGEHDHLSIYKKPGT